MAETPSRARRRKWLWLGAGLGLGVALVFVVLALPPVQGWLIRYALTRQAGTEVEFSRMRVGPGGASAQELKLRLPNFAVEARALRLAVSPWQLLTRRRLALDSVEARDLQLTARVTDEPSSPFTGLLEQLRAPLDWAVTHAEAEGRFILEQTGAEPIDAAFKIRGTELSAERPGELDLEFSAPGNLVSGWQGEWIFSGKLNYTPGPNGTLMIVGLRGTLAPAAHADLQAFPLQLTASVQATPAGESYTLRIVPADASAPGVLVSAQAAFAAKTADLTGTWNFATAAQLAAHLLKRGDLPEVSFAGEGEFAVNTGSGEVTGGGDVTLTGQGWERLAPELAGFGAAHGRNRFAVARRGGVWQLESFDATMSVANSPASVRFRSLESQPLIPFRTGDTAWAELEVGGIPLEWAKPFLPGVEIQGGTIQGSWQASTPSATELQLRPTRPVETGRFTLAHAALPAVQPLQFSLSPVVRLTPEAAHLELKQLRFAFERGDYLEVDVASKVDFRELTAALDLSWRAELPSLLAGPEKPLPFRFTGELAAKAGADDVLVSRAHVAARFEQGDAVVFGAELLQPVRYRLADGQIEAGPEMAKFYAAGLPLAWLGRFQPDYALAGTLARGESVVGIDSGKITLRTTTPWTLEGLAVTEKGEPLLRDLFLEARPEATINWPLVAIAEFKGSLNLQARVTEAMRVFDPTGPFDLSLEVTAGRSPAGLFLENLGVLVRRGNTDPLLELRTHRAMVFKKDAPASDNLPVWFTLRMGRFPLELLKPLLAPTDDVAGEIAPAEFVAQADWPTLQLRGSAPVEVMVQRYVSDGVPWLENVKITAEPGIQNSALVHAAYVENLRGLPPTGALGSLGAGFIMFLGDNFSMPVAMSFQTQVDLAQWQRQPIADAFSLPLAGLITTKYDHDLINDKQPRWEFALEHVPAADGQGQIAPLKVSATTELGAAATRDEVVAHVEVELGTQPRVTKVAFDAALNNREKMVNVNSTLKGEFVDVAEVERLIAATDRPALLARAAESAPPEQTAENPAANGAPPPAAAGTPRTEPTSGTFGEGILAQSSLEYPFWLVIRGRFDLELGELARAHYRIQDVRGALELRDTALEIKDLSGRTFDGAWSGGLKVDFTPTAADAPYRLAGNFGVSELDAAAIVTAVYPDEPPLFTGRLSFASEVSSHGQHLAGLLKNGAARFRFQADDGRLHVKVPHANLASTALVFGGAITLSPELRALGRLITKFDGMPVDTLRASGRREPDGLVALDEFQVATPQLRLSATGRWQLEEGKPWVATPFELPVSISARDEIGVILKGMRLLEKKPGADGFFRVTRQPKLKGTPGQPDTSELFDMLAHAADKSTGTFGLLMRKLQKEVVKATGGGAKPAAK